MLFMIVGGSFLVFCWGLLLRFGKKVGDGFCYEDLF